VLGLWAEEQGQFCVKRDPLAPVWATVHSPRYVFILFWARFLVPFPNCLLLPVLTPSTPLSARAHQLLAGMYTHRAVFASGCRAILVRAAAQGSPLIVDFPRLWLLVVAN